MSPAADVDRADLADEFGGDDADQGGERRGSMRAEVTQPSEQARAGVHASWGSAPGPARGCAPLNPGQGRALDVIHLLVVW